MFNKIMKELSGLKSQWGRVKGHTAATKKAAHRKELTTAIFIPAPNASLDGTALVAHYRGSFKRLEKVLGPPHAGDDEGSEWRFKSAETNATVALYDHKSYMSRAELRKKPHFDFSVGARDKKTATQFLVWLRKQR